MTLSLNHGFVRIQLTSALCLTTTQFKKTNIVNKLMHEKNINLLYYDKVILDKLQSPISTSSGILAGGWLALFTATIASSQP